MLIKPNLTSTLAVLYNKNIVRSREAEFANLRALHKGENDHEPDQPDQEEVLEQGQEEVARGGSRTRELTPGGGRKEFQASPCPPPRKYLGIAEYPGSH